MFWPPKKKILPFLALGGVSVLLAVGLSVWLLEKRIEHIKENPSQPVPEVHVNAHLQPLPDAWDDVVREIYRLDPPQTPSPRPKITATRVPGYIKNAEHLPRTAPNTPKIAIVIDDVGVHGALSHRAENVLPPAVTFSYLPYGTATKELVKKARENNREVMIHLPMEPMPRPEEPPINPGDNALYVGMGLDNIRAKTRLNLQDFQDVAVGVNNHMGSRFTSSQGELTPALEEIHKAGLFFMDSLTTPQSAVQAAAKEATPGMPLLVRDVFLDHYQTEEGLINALVQLEAQAQKKGQAIAIGHPHAHTLEVLVNWIPTLKHKGIALVPITHLLPAPKPKITPPEGNLHEPTLRHPEKP